LGVIRVILAALFYDAQRDLVDLGRPDIADRVHRLDKLGYEDEALPGDGVIFCTYQSLIAKNAKGKTRMELLVAWCTASTMTGDPVDFEGCLCFDEAHRSKNLGGGKGKAEGSQTARAVLDLQQSLRGARVVYVSATAAAEIRDLGYMTRLGLWGEGTPFGDFEAFKSALERAKVSGMELIAMDMKARGLFIARMLSFAGCSFEKRVCILSGGDRVIYDAATEWWEALLQGFAKCISLTDADESAGRSFWGSHQAFFKQLLNSLKCSFAISECEMALERGECVVIGLLSTGEAKAGEAIERATKAGKELEAEISTPHEIAMEMLNRHLPVVNSQGAMVPEALAVREHLLRQLKKIHMPGNALDMLISHFGVDRVAEMTGRKTRVVTYPYGRTVSQNRAPRGISHEQHNIDEKDAFLKGTKRIAIISEAASAGISLHADHRFANQSRRLHITLELAWSAEKMIQQFGRTHRSNQSSAPHYLLLVTDVGGEQRFASSVARKLETLGAMTRGDRRGGHGAAAELVSHNLDTPHGHDALSILLDVVAENAMRDQLWERALRMLRCHRDGVPTLLGLSVVAVAQEYAAAEKLHCEARPSRSSKAADARRAEAKRRAIKLVQGVERQLPQGLQQYVIKLKEWVAPKLNEAMRSRGGSGVASAKTADYGACPKTPQVYGISWLEAKDALQRMRLLTPQLVPTNESDRKNINRFLNRLLGLPIGLQNALFAFYNAIFRWVVLSAKSQGDVDNGVGLLHGESVRVNGEPQIVFRDPRSSATTLIHSVCVDTGLSWLAALGCLQAALADPQIKATHLGGSTGFWQHTKTHEVILAIELPSSHTDRRHRIHRLLRPTLHTSAKPQFVPMAKLIGRYVCLRLPADAENLWKERHKAQEAARFEELRLVTGAILPIWTPLVSALRTAPRRSRTADYPIVVKKCMCDGQPLVGVVLDERLVVELRKRLEDKEGGRQEDIEEATRKRKAGLAEAARKRAAVFREKGAFAKMGDNAAGVALLTDRALADGSDNEDGDDDDDEDEEEEELDFSGGSKGAGVFTAPTVPCGARDDDDGLLDMIGD